MTEQKPGFKTGWCGARDVPTIEPLEREPLRNTLVKGLGFKPGREYEIVRELEKMLVEARQKVAELEARK